MASQADPLKILSSLLSSCIFSNTKYKMNQLNLEIVDSKLGIWNIAKDNGLRHITTNSHMHLPLNKE